ncbi:MAG: hypothetical protein IT531_15505 [Burkholderiales bacterium]|nr:hypothetical protein [Burkholderiales bacterium]
MRTGRIAGLLYALLLGGCALVPEKPGPPPAVASVQAPVPTAPVCPPAEPAPAAVQPAPPPAPVVVTPVSVQAMDYLARARQRSPRELSNEVEAARKAFAATRSEHDRVRLALLLSLPNLPFSDEAQALELLEPLTRDAGSEYQSLAQLVTGLVAEQRRRGVQASALQQKLDRIKALEQEMQQRAARPESRRR